MSWVYVKSEPGLWTVGYYDPDHSFIPDSDWPSIDEAAKRVSYLNGGSEFPVKAESGLQSIKRDWKHELIPLDQSFSAEDGGCGYENLFEMVLTRHGFDYEFPGYWSNVINGYDVSISDGEGENGIWFEVQITKDGCDIGGTEESMSVYDAIIWAFKRCSNVQ